MRDIPDGPADAGRRLHRYWYRESRCQVRTGWQKILCSLWLYLLILAYFPSRSVKICVNPWLMNYLCAYKAPFCAFCAFLRLIRTVFSRPKTCLPHEIAQRYLFGVISASKNLCNLLLKICAICGKNLCNLW